jgi:hypothetical protein
MRIYTNTMKHSHILSFILFAILIIVAHVSAVTSYAYKSNAVASAHLAFTQTKSVDNRAEILRAYLTKYNSPLAPHAKTFVSEADKYNLDWKFVASIAGVESWFGQRIPANSYNGWGWGVYGNNVHRFASWDDGITTISRELRMKYMDKWGAKDIYGIGNRYAADPKWPSKVLHFMNQIEAFAEEYENPSLSISL